MHWTIENPRREIPRQTPLAQIDIRRWVITKLERLISLLIPLFISVRI